MPKDTLKNALNGIIPSLRIPFYRDGAIDYGSFAAIIDQVMDSGCPLLMFTYTDAQLMLLDDEEISTLIRFVANRGQRKVWYVYADRPCGTNKAVEHARYSRDYFADAIVVLPPCDGEHTTVAGLVHHYRMVAREVPVLIDTAAFQHAPDMGREVIGQLHADDDNIIGIVDSIGMPWIGDVCQQVSNKWSVITAGSQQNHLNLLPRGGAGHLSTLAVIQPEAAQQYAAAITAGDTTQAQALIQAIDTPFFSAVDAVTGGTQAGIHAAMELAGISQRWRRAPFYSLSDPQVAELKKSLSNVLAGRRGTECRAI